MRTPLVCSFAVLLNGLAAQHLSPRSAYPPPPPAEEVANPTPQDILAARDGIAGRPLPRVMFDRPSAQGPLWAVGTAWKASFDATGTTVVPFFGSRAPRNFPLRLELAQVTVGGEALPVADGEPVQSEGTVRTPRGALTEVFATQLDSLEQSFVFDHLPNRGAIAVDVRIDGEYSVAPISGGLRFANEWGHFDYTKAVAVDADGAQLPLDITCSGNHIHMEIPASFVDKARLPLVLDPVLNGWFGIASGIGLLQYGSDVASYQRNGGRTLIVYMRQWSATDGDCWGVMFDGVLGLVQTDFPIDASVSDWKNVAVASNNFAQNFLAVAEVSGVASWWIVGRMIAGSAALGALFDIERDGVIGLPGNSFAPDVGGDPTFLANSRYTVVFMKRPNIFSNAQTIYMRQVSTSGAVVTTNPILIYTNTAGVDRPAISKSCGQLIGSLPQHWLLTWQRTWPFPPDDQEVWGRFVDWNGAVIGSNFAIGFTPAEETRPSPSSPIDANGTRFWPVAHETATTLGQPRDIVCQLMRSDGGAEASFTVNNNVPGSDDKEPEIDSDGTRFVTTYSISTVGSPQRVEAVTAAFLRGSNTFRVEERTGLQTSALDSHGQTNICADYSGGSSMSPRYFISFSEQSTNTFGLRNFGGYTGGTTYFFNQGLGCGTLSINATGTPAIGQDILVTVGNGAASAVIFGVPGFIPLNALGCNCVQGVDQYLYFNNPMSWTVPNNPLFVGIPLAVQGFTVVGSQCLGFVDLSDTLNFTIR